MAPRKRCPVCRSKQWHKEPSSGLIACSEGHILQNYRAEVTEVDELGRHAVKKRTLKSNRQKNVRTDNTDPKLYHGNRGRFFYFQCLQLILRHQVAVLIEHWALPSELEVVCRDLWALHLSLLRNPPPSESSLGAHESDAEELKDEDDADPAAFPFERARKSPSPDELEVPKPPSSVDDDKDGVKEEEETDPELEELLAENSASESSSSDGEDEINSGKTKLIPPSKRKSQSRKARFEQPANTIAVIVLACWTLRIPILYRDLTRLIESYELPYLEATRVLPQSMTVHLTKQNIQALSPPKTPTALALHTLASSLAKRLHFSFGVRTPEANAAPILWRVVTQCLGGTPTLYGLTKRLSTVLSLPLTLHHSLAPHLKRVKQRDPESHKFDNVAPELAFVVTGIIVLKMVYGLDRKERLPVDSEDWAGDLPRIDEYLQLLGKLDDADIQAAAFGSKTAMVIEDLSDDTVDEYLSFCERALVGPANERAGLLERFFPLPEPQTVLPKAVNGDGEGVRAELRATRLPDREEETMRPGEEYAFDEGEMSDQYAAIVSRAARWVGVRDEYLRRVTATYERRFQAGWLRVRRGTE
ncbi:hypothetical protein K438DRAFT_1586954 [Mycena galopus ATCC 62051]|nr:hypothetical protein K438DRAFT_1586954 [Mycena galopus ATCC 62051]